MDENLLVATVRKLVAEPKGVLALDESTGTCGSRFEKLGVENTEEKRREYRNMLITTPGLEEFISGVILVEETAKQKSNDGVPFPEVLNKKGICVGVTAYKGYAQFEDGVEKITEGIEDFAVRIKEYKALGAVFSKWREQVKIGEGLPTEKFLEASAERMAEYALICQENSIVPFIEPEILIDGDHTMEKCYEVTAKNMDIIFDKLTKREVFLPGIILKTSMVLPGKDSKVAIDDTEIAKATIRLLKEKVPAEVKGIVFLSGGQDDLQATNRLNEMHKLGPLPWALTFSYGRAIQNPALKSWAAGDPIEESQKRLLFAARNNSLASIGKYEM